MPSLKCTFSAAATAFALLLAADPVTPALAQSAQVEIAYEEPAHANLCIPYTLLKRRAVLEELQAFLKPLRLPGKLTVKTAQCGAPTVAL